MECDMECDPELAMGRYSGRMSIVAPGAGCEYSPNACLGEAAVAPVAAVAVLAGVTMGGA